MANPDPPTPLIDENAADIAQAPDLCTRCGLCCTGVIHNAAVLDQDEVEAAGAVGLPVLDRPGRPGFGLPCPKLVDLKCTIFGHRPRVCGRYMCQVLIDYREGLLSFAEAEAHVDYAHKLVATMRALLPEGMPLRQAKALIGAAQGEDAAEHDPHLAQNLSELRLRITALELFLDKQFRRAKELKALDMREIEKE